VWSVAGGLLIFVINSVVDVILTMSWIRFGQRMVYDLAKDLFAHVQRRSLLFHHSTSVGDSMGRITVDSWCVYTLLNTLLFKPVHTTIGLVAMIWLMVHMNLVLTLVALAVAPFMVAASVLLGKPTRAAAHERRQVESQIQSHVQQTLSGIPVVQAFGQEDREHHRFRQFTSMAIRTQQRSTLVGGINTLASGLSLALGTGVILWVSAHLVLSGRLTIGSMLVFLSYLGSLQKHMKAFTGMHTALQQAGASVERVLEVLEEEQEVRDRADAQPLPHVQGHIRLEQVSFGYEKNRAVLHEVSLEAQPGQTVAIVGPTGAGKSTLVGLVPRFFDPWQGRVLIDGQDVRTVQLKSLRQQVSLVLQEPFLFPLSIAENIAYGRPEASRAEIEAAARAANAHAFIERLPEGYDTVVGERGATLSGGERQRLSIARALLKDAPILILDEPTSALDAETEGLLLEALERLMEGRTTLIIAHRLSTIRKADQIVVLREGVVEEVGTHDELLQQQKLYAKLYNSRSGESGPDGESDEAEEAYLPEEPDRLEDARVSQEPEQKAGVVR
jgi:ATP-binding cassette subfamily B protein/subfamily B ATP-binding cassette protein MsbA